jgi:two-component system, OmpR family, sensor kinase
MRTGRLRLAVYVGAFAVLFVVGGLFLAFQTVRRRPQPTFKAVTYQVVQNLARQIGEPARLRADLTALSRTQLEVSLYGADRHLIASSVLPPLAPALDDDDEDSTRFTHWVPLPDGGRVLGVCNVRDPLLNELLLPLLVLLASLTGLAIVITRHVGTPLQRLADAARRFGRGELSARARIDRKDELGEVGSTFDEMADRVTSLMSAQRELMANVSHELQTPLARVQVAVDLMLDGVSDQVKLLLPEISSDLGEVERLIDDVMTLARLDLAHAEGQAAVAPLRPETVSMSNLVERAATRFRSLHPNRALEIRTNPALPELSIDPVLVRRVIDNLLENARKYSEPDTSILLFADAFERFVRVEISDRGIGIEATDLKRVFTPFFRTDRSRTRATGGVGLGMVLARRVIEAHGGSIRIASQPNRGTTVTFELPVSRSPGAMDGVSS